MTNMMVLTRDSCSVDTLLKNGFRRECGDNGMLKSNPDANIANTIKLCRGNVWVFGLDLDCITVYYDSGRHSVWFEYGMYRMTNRELTSFLEAIDDGRLMELCGIDIANGDIVKGGGDKVVSNADFFHGVEEFDISFSEESKLKKEMLELVRLSRDNSATTDQLPAYIDNLMSLEHR